MGNNGLGQRVLGWSKRDLTAVRVVCNLLAYQSNSSDPFLSQCSCINIIDAWEKLKWSQQANFFFSSAKQICSFDNKCVTSLPSSFLGNLLTLFPISRHGHAGIVDRSYCIWLNKGPRKALYAWSYLTSPAFIANTLEHLECSKHLENCDSLSLFPPCLPQSIFLL